MWVVVAAVAGALLAWAALTAQRLDRLHIRVDRCRDALQAALDRRCVVIAAYLPQLADQAHATEAVQLRARDMEARLAAEDLLRGQIDLIDLENRAAHAIAEADTRVMLALRFYNEAVTDTRALRLQPLIRVLRLGGSAALPQFASLHDLG